MACSGRTILHLGGSQLHFNHNFSQNKSNVSNIWTECSCHLQEFPQNDVKHISRNQSNLPRETLWGGWRNILRYICILIFLIMIFYMISSSVQSKNAAFTWGELVTWPVTSTGMEIASQLFHFCDSPLIGYVMRASKPCGHAWEVF